MLRATITRGRDAGKSFLLQTFPITIGREVEKGLVLEDVEVSRKHVRIKNRGKLFIIEDLGSKNGTFLNGDRVMNAVVRSGDLLLVGDTELQLDMLSQFVNVTGKSSGIHIVDDSGGDGVVEAVSLSGQVTKRDFEMIPLRREGEVSIFNKLSENLVGCRKVYHHQSSVLAQETLEGCCQSLLRILPQIVSYAAGAVVFVWSGQSHRLIPMAKVRYAKNQEEEIFHVSRKALSECFFKKQGFRLLDKQEQIGSNSVRYLFPVVHLGRVLAVLHIETEDRRAVFSPGGLHLIEDLLARTAPSLEVHLLRTDADAMMLGMVEAMIAAVEAKDTYTVGHSERVCKYSMAMAHALKIPHETKKLLMISSLCHDIGKIGIPDAILKKATLLSTEEYEEMKLHPTIGAGILANVPNAKKFLSGIKYHHEKWDGTGYPEGLVGESIPFFGRIVAVADVFDAMISGRSYSGFIEEEDAIEKIQREAELFDPEILASLIKAWEEGLISQRTSTQHHSEKVERDLRESQQPEALGAEKLKKGKNFAQTSGTMTYSQPLAGEEYSRGKKNKGSKG
ncbi:MAG: HD domain-containing protein [Zetaproteobacteria bacterium]|nr:HD domain-containing protein [Zetaproteobacteria bacterium]